MSLKIAFDAPDIYTWVNLHEFVEDGNYFRYRHAITEIDIRIRQTWQMRQMQQNHIDVEIGELNRQTLALILRQHPMTRLILIPEADAQILRVPLREYPRVGQSQ